MADKTAFRVKIPPAIQKYLKKDAPKDVRLLAAQGLVPMPPLVQATVLTFFLDDADPEIIEASQKTLRALPDNVLETVLGEPAHPRTLDFFARERGDAEHLLEAILLNNNTTDETFVFLSDKVPERLTTIIMNNQVRLLRTPAIGEGVKKNPNALKSAVETMVSFLRLSGILLEGESPELTAEEMAEILHMPEPTVEVPENAPPPAPAAAAEFPSEFLDEFEEEEEDDEKEEKKKGIYQAVQDMNVGGKIKLALLGNKEARQILIKDSNKIVATSVVKSPKITDGEVLSIANMRTVYDDVIRIIARTQEWTRHYAVQVALANNPKTPFPIALKYARMLTVSDLAKLSKNKNVPGQLSKIAKGMYDQKRT